MRGWLACGVLALVAAEMLGFFLLTFCHVILMADIKELGWVLFSPTVSVLGVVLGFYFGGTRGDR